MPVILGSGEYRYEVHDHWAKLPPGREFNADVAAVGVDRQDRVYAFNRGEHPMVVFDRDGNFLRCWGDGVFRRAHGVHMAPDDTLWLTDDGRRLRARLEPQLQELAGQALKLRDSALRVEQAARDSARTVHEVASRTPRG